MYIFIAKCYLILYRKDKEKRKSTLVIYDKWLVLSLLFMESRHLGVLVLLYAYQFLDHIFFIYFPNKIFFLCTIHTVLSPFHLQVL